MNLRQQILRPHAQFRVGNGLRSRFAKLKEVSMSLYKTHLHVGVAAIAMIVLHVPFMGLSDLNPFLWWVLALIFWQGLFGFLTPGVVLQENLEESPTGCMPNFLLGLWSGYSPFFFGHLLADDGTTPYLK